MSVSVTKIHQYLIVASIYFWAGQHIWGEILQKNFIYFLSWFVAHICCSLRFPRLMKSELGWYKTRSTGTDILERMWTKVCVEPLSRAELQQVSDWLVSFPGRITTGQWLVGLIIFVLYRYYVRIILLTRFNKIYEINTKVDEEGFFAIRSPVFMISVHFIVDHFVCKLLHG